MKQKVLFFLMVCLLSVPVFAADSGVRFSGLNGQVESRPDADPSAWDFADLNTVLNVMDHIKTGIDSSAVLSFSDMSTFVLKSESEIVVASPPDKDSKVQLVKGNIWVNVKKMVKDGSMDIEMNQAVAGIKGTNITCQTDGDEDRIQVLRGLAAVLIKETQETVMVNEGEELVIKTGGKAEKKDVDVGAVQDSWKKELSSLGDSIQMDEIPQMLRDILGSEEELFSGIANDFKVLAAATSPSQEDVDEFQKNAERFLGVILEDQVLLAAAAQKVNNGLADAAGNPAKLSMLNGYLKSIAEARAKMDGYSNEIGKMLKAKFNVQTGAADGVAESAVTDLEAIWGEVEGIMAEISANPTGMSQDWFLESQDKLNDALTSLGELSQRVNDLLNEYPTDPTLLALQKKIADYQSQIGTLLKEVAVVEIDTTVLTEMQDTDDQMSDSIVLLRSELDSYNSTVKNAEAPTRLRSSLSILNNFSKARRLYLSSQRLYDSTMRSAGSTKYKTAEIDELEQTFDRITNTYQQLGIVAEQLEGRLQELESQLGTYLK